MDKKPLSTKLFLPLLIDVINMATDSLVLKTNNEFAQVNLIINKYKMMITASFDGRYKEYLVWDSTEFPPLVQTGKRELKLQIKEYILKAHKNYKEEYRSQLKRRKERRRLRREETDYDEEE